MPSDQQYFSIFRALPTPCLIIRPEVAAFTIEAANAAYLELSQQTEGTLVGQGPRGVYNPIGENDEGTFESTLLASLEQVRLTYQPHSYVLRGTLDHGVWELTNSPVLPDDHGEVLWIIHTLHYRAPAENLVPASDHTTVLPNKKQIDYEYAIDQANMVSISDPTGKIIDVNDLFCAFSGYTRAELVGQRLNALSLDHHLTSVGSDIWKPMEAGQVWQGEVHNKTKSGRYYWAQLTIVPLLDYTGTPYQYMTFWTDITEQKEAELKRAESERKYRDLFQYSPLPMWVYEVDTLRFLDVNEAAIRHYGYSREEFLSMTIREIRPPEEVPQLEENLARIRQYESRYSTGTYRHQKKNGAVIDVELQSNIVYFLDTKCELVLANDITDRLAVNQQLYEINEKLRTAQQLARLGYWEFDLKKGTAYWSKEMFKIWELPPEQGALSLEEYQATIHPEYRDLIQFQDLDQLQHLPLQSIEYRIITGQQQVKYIHQLINVILAPDGTAAKLNGTVQDITQQKTTESTLRQKTRLLEAINQFNTALLYSHNNDWPLMLEEAFAIVGQALQADRVFYFEYHPDTPQEAPSTSERSINWTRPDIKAQIPHSDLQQKPAHLFKKYLEPLWTNRNEPFWAEVNTLPPNHLRELLTGQGIASFLIVPLYIRGTFHGFVGFDDFHTRRHWSEEEQGFLQTIANNLAIVIEEQKTRESLKESEQKLTSLISNLPGITYRCLADNDWTMLFISDEIERVTGYSASDFIHNQRRSFNSIIHPDDVEIVRTVIALLKNQEVFQLAYRLIAADGNSVWVEEKGMGIYDKQGNLLWIDGVIMDITEKKSTYEKFKAVFEHTQDAIFLADDQAKLLDFNRICTTLLGYTPDELQQLYVNDIFKIEETNTAFLENWGSFLEKGTQSGITELLRKDGSVIIGSFNAQPNILPGLHLVVVTDITEKVKQEQVLQASEKRFKALVQDGSELIAILDTAGNYLFVSDSSTSQLGILPEEFVGKSAFEFIHPEDRERVLWEFEVLDKVHQAQLTPFRFRNKEGEWRWITTLVTNMTDEPAVQGIVANSRDITEAIQQAQELQLSNERYRLVLKASNEAISDWDIEKNYVEWGQGFHDLFGYDLSVHNQRLWSDNIHPEDRERVLNELRQVLQDPTQEIFHSEYRFLKANRESAIIQHRAIFLRNEQGRAIRSLASFRDITEVHESWYKIQQQNDKLREIAWIQSHIIRAPVARIMGLIDLLKDQSTYQNEAEWTFDEILEYISTSLHELDDIIHDIVEKSAHLK